MATKTPDATKKPAAAPKRKVATKPKAKPSPAPVAAAAPVSDAKPASVKPPKLPKVPTTITESGSKVEPVVLDSDELLIKYHLKDRMEGEVEALTAQRESVMATLKGQIKEKQEEIAELTRITRTKVEERNIPTWLHYNLKLGIRYTYKNTGKPLNVRKDKPIDTEPMTPQEKRKFEQPALLEVPATPKIEGAAGVVIVKDGEGKSLAELGADKDGKVGFVEIDFPPIEGKSAKLSIAENLNPEERDTLARAAKEDAAAEHDEDDIPEHL